MKSNRSAERRFGLSSNPRDKVMFDLQEAAIGYVKSAERILGEDARFLNENPEVVPIFISLPFQSLEISLKHLGLESKLFSEQESRDRKLTKNGHGILEIANLINDRLGAKGDFPVIMALTAGMIDTQHQEILQRMIFDLEGESVRKSYESRNLGYLQLKPDDLKLLSLKPWVTSVREVAYNLPRAIDVVISWKNSTSRSGTFAIWYK